MLFNAGLAPKVPRVVSSTRRLLLPPFHEVVRVAASQEESTLLVPRVVHADSFLRLGHQGGQGETSPVRPVVPNAFTSARAGKGAATRLTGLTVRVAVAALMPKSAVSHVGSSRVENAVQVPIANILTQGRSPQSRQLRWQTA